MPITPDMFFLDTRFRGTLQSQIQQMVAEGILTGRFQPGEKLPSTRKLARHLGVSRITVTLAYTELLSNDYLTSRGRSGYFISPEAPQPRALRDLPPHGIGEALDWSQRLVGRPAELPVLEKPPNWRDYTYPFIYGQADKAIFDTAAWRLCALQALGQREFDSLTGDHADRDDPLLVDFLTRHILPRRGIVAGPDEVLITAGGQNGLWLAAELLLGPGRRAAIERPGYPALFSILARTGCATLPVHVDRNGLPPENLPAAIDVAFATPSHQCPTNATMPLARRKLLLEKAAAEDFIVVEDDYEFELSFLKAPHPSLRSLDREGRVIYVGSFSKSLFPGLRLGYLVAAPPFVAAARALRSAVLRHPPGQMQRTAAHFMRLGHYDALLKRMGRTLAERRAEMARALRTHGLDGEGGGDFGGSSFWMRAPDHVDTETLAQRLAEQDGVLIEPGRAFWGPEGQGNTYRLAYSSIPLQRIEPGLGLIARAIAAF